PSPRPPRPLPSATLPSPTTPPTDAASDRGPAGPPSTCFHGTLIQPPPHPEEARRAVSKGGMHRRCCPSFETPRYARLLRMRLSVNSAIPALAWRGPLLLVSAYVCSFWGFVGGLDAKSEKRG